MAITLQKRHISVLARLFGERIGSDLELDTTRKVGRPSKAELEARKAQENAMPAQISEAHTKVMKALYDRAMAGDVPAIREWHSLNAPQSDAPFNVQISIHPYNIDDKSLPRIVQQADTPVVMEIFEGLKSRMEADEAPRELKELLRCLRGQYGDWAAEAYAPKDL